MTERILPNPIKSENDNKDYRIIMLKNGLTALLIHQPHSQTDTRTQSEDGASNGNGTAQFHRSAASLTVRVGSFDNPDDLPGMAHFLEHMVFMGSEKYPSENGFVEFIMQNGGKFNAYTDRRTTTFFFDAQPKHLKEGLDRLAQFFISPLLKKEAMQREREAVESEYNLISSRDSQRKWHVLFSLGKENHPATKFQCGNKRTLGGEAGADQERKDDEVHAKLREFRERHHVAEMMTLAVQSTHNLDTLQEYVVSLFGAVPTGKPPRTLRPVVLPELRGPFDNDKFNKVYYVSPVKDIQQVQLTWMLPPIVDKYRSKPNHYASYLIGHGGKGGLLDYLRKKVWALDLEVESSDSESNNNVYYLYLGILVSLTKEGSKNISKVLRAIFRYLHKVQTGGPNEYIYNELKALAETEFRFTPEPSSAENVQLMAKAMQRYPCEHYITGSKLYYDYDPESIKELFKGLRHDNVNIIIWDSQLNLKYDQKDPWYNTPFTVKDNICGTTIEDISEKQASWKDSFILPEPNPFLPSNFTIFEPEEDCTDYPAKVLENAAGELWFKQDRKFNLPTAAISFQLISPFINTSKKRACMLDLIICCWKLQLCTIADLAKKAGYFYSISSTDDTKEGPDSGIFVKVWGYNEKLPLFLETVLKEWDGFEVELNKEMFDAIKNEKKKSYLNNAFDSSQLRETPLAVDVANSLIKSTHWTDVERYEAIDSITCDELIFYSKQLKWHMYCRMLIQGNMLKAQAIKTFDLVLKQLKCKTLSVDSRPLVRMMQLPLGESFVTVKSLDMNSPNSAITQYFFCGLTSFRDVCISDVIMPVFTESAFDFLRTKEKLGYWIRSPVSVGMGVLRFAIAVKNQEQVNPLSVVDGKIQEFLLQFKYYLKKMTPERVNELKVSAMGKKLQADHQLMEEINRNWEEIRTEEYMFDRRQKEHDVIATITHDEIVEFFNKYVFNKHFVRSLTVAVKAFVPPGNKTSDDGKSPLNGIRIENTDPGKLKRKVIHIKDIEMFKKGLFMYPTHKILY